MDALMHQSRCQPETPPCNPSSHRQTIRHGIPACVHERGPSKDDLFAIPVHGCGGHRERITSGAAPWPAAQRPPVASVAHGQADRIVPFGHLVKVEEVEGRPAEGGGGSSSSRPPPNSGSGSPASRSLSSASVGNGLHAAAGGPETRVMGLGLDDEDREVGALVVRSDDQELMPTAALLLEERQEADEARADAADSPRRVGHPATEAGLAADRLLAVEYVGMRPADEEQIDELCEQ